MADMNEVSALLHIHEKAAAHGGALNNIAQAALARLRQINEEHIGFGLEAEPTPEPTHEEDHDDGE